MANDPRDHEPDYGMILWKAFFVAVGVFLLGVGLFGAATSNVHAALWYGVSPGRVLIIMTAIGAGYISYKHWTK